MTFYIFIFSKAFLKEVYSCLLSDWHEHVTIGFIFLFGEKQLLVYSRILISKVVISCIFWRWWYSVYSWFISLENSYFV